MSQRLLFGAFLFWILVPSAFALTGNEYRNLGDTERSVWVTGVADGLLTEQLIRTGEQPALARCLAQYTTNQIVAIFDKHLGENPESWNHPAAFSFRFKFHGLCNIED